MTPDDQKLHEALKARSLPIPPELQAMLPSCNLLDGCQYCGIPFDVIAYRYLCPHCHIKNTCCE